MLPYFPIEDAFTMSVGARPLGGLPLIEVDLAHYREEIALKHQIIAGDPRYYVQSLPGFERAQWEALALVLRAFARDHPQHAALEVDGEQWAWHNHLTGEKHLFRYGRSEDLPLTPLDWAGRQVQEDLLLMDASAPGVPLVAGQLAFGSMWCLDDKMGRSILGIHEDVPGFNDQIGRPTQMLMERLKPERPVWRVNWTIKSDPRLDHAPRFRDELMATKRAVTAENAGERCFFRTERQTLSRLPETNTVLFTIHTYRTRMDEVAADPERARKLLGTLRSTPPAMLAYKGIAPFAAPLIAYLEAS